MAEPALKDVLLNQRIVLCCGTGGVGKTTTAAAAGILGANLGKKTLVVTIDPARRLAHAMGLDDLSHTPHPVPGVDNLFAMMLEPGATIDELVSRHASSPESAARVLANPYYQQLSSTLAGSREFMAIEKLYELSSDAAWDLIIVDTPPSQHALDFLDAPRHLLELMDGTGLGLILRSTNVANRLSFGLLRRSQTQFAKFFEFLTGHRLLLDVTDFYHRYADVIDGFKQRAIKLEDMLRAGETSFFLILIAEEDLVAQAANFKASLEEADMRLSCVVFNQVLSILPVADLDEVEREAKVADIEPGLLERALHCHQGWFRTSQRQHKVIKAWRKTHDAAVSLVPRFDTNVSTIEELQRFADTL